MYEGRKIQKAEGKIIAARQMQSYIIQQFVPLALCVIQRWSKVITERTTAAACWWCYNIKATPQVLFFAIVTHLDPAAAAAALKTTYVYVCWLGPKKRALRENTV